MRYIREIKNCKKKNVLVRVDVNVPIGKDRKVDMREDWRIEKSLATIRYLTAKGARVILLAHLGDAHGKIVGNLRLRPVVQRIHDLLRLRSPVRGIKFPLVPRGLWPGYKIGYNLFCLENLRYHPGEENNDLRFAKQLASLGDIYVNDAFSASHRKHASLVAITKYLPSYAGSLLEEEVSRLHKILESPRHPLVIVLGGMKIETKLPLIERMIKIADHILVGGALANNFFAALGHGVGKSIVDKNEIAIAKKLLKKTGRKLVLPVDMGVGKGRRLVRRAKELEDVKQDEAILDIGPQSIVLFRKYIAAARMIVWNGAMGYYEDPRFFTGTERIARAVAQSKAETIVGGGETDNVIESLGLTKKISFVSTGGGAMIQFLAGMKLPGLDVLTRK